MNPDNAKKLILSAVKAADSLGIARSTLNDFHQRGLIPLPIKLGGRVLWRAHELKRWTAAGCPVRERWIYLQKPQGRNGA